MRTIAIIPARLESSRLPNKLLLSETGKPLIQYTCEAAQRAVDAGVIDGYFVLTDSEKIYQSVQMARVTVFAKSIVPPRNGTERIAKYVWDSYQCPHDYLFINWQADEPELTPEHIQALVDAWHANPRYDYATLVCDDLTEEMADDYNTVMIMSDGDEFPGDAVVVADGFSRSVYGRFYDGHFRHIGAYAYDARYLEWYLSTPPSEREQSESLEQLRFPQARCHAAVIENAPHGINTRADYDAFCERMKANK